MICLQIAFQLQRSENALLVSIDHTLGRLVLRSHKTLGRLSIEKKRLRLSLIRVICSSVANGNVFGMSLDATFAV